MSNIYKVTDFFIENKRINETDVSIYLISGVKIDGKIIEFDSVGIILNTNQLIFRNAISTIQDRAIKWSYDRIRYS